MSDREQLVMKSFFDEPDYTVKQICVEGNVGAFLGILDKKGLLEKCTVYVFELCYDRNQPIEEDKEFCIFIKNCHAVLSTPQRVKEYVEKRKNKAYMSA